VAPLPTAPRSRVQQNGPWLIGGGAVLVALVAEIYRHHVISEEETLFFVILVPTIILHEISHGVVALWCGDRTAKDAGRLSLNPLRHIDIFGTILLPLVLILKTGHAFGWAKPVPVNVANLRSPRNQAVLVSLAGPALNILIALVAGFALHLVANAAVLPYEGFSSWPIVDQLLLLLGYTNVLIAVFNLIPVPPLDGSAVIERFLPASALPTYYRFRMFSMILVIILAYGAPGLLDSLFSHAGSIWASAVGIGDLHVGF
jgi:Zn-dependent protease